MPQMIRVGPLQDSRNSIRATIEVWATTHLAHIGSLVRFWIAATGLLGVSIRLCQIVQPTTKSRPAAFVLLGYKAKAQIGLMDNVRLLEKGISVLKDPLKDEDSITALESKELFLTQDFGIHSDWYSPYLLIGRYSIAESSSGGISIICWRLKHLFFQSESKKLSDNPGGRMTEIFEDKIERDRIPSLIKESFDVTWGLKNRVQQYPRAFGANERFDAGSGRLGIRIRGGSYVAESLSLSDVLYYQAVRLFSGILHGLQLASHNLQLFAKLPLARVRLPPC
jgi:hypothetical protein